jgi:hypothetical protein
LQWRFFCLKYGKTTNHPCSKIPFARFLSIKTLNQQHIFATHCFDATPRLVISLFAYQFFRDIVKPLQIKGLVELAQSCWRLLIQSKPKRAGSIVRRFK